MEDQRFPWIYVNSSALICSNRARRRGLSYFEADNQPTPRTRLFWNNDFAGILHDEFRVVLDFFGNSGGIWSLDGNYLSSVPGYFGTPVGDPEFVTDARIGTGALDLDGNDAVVINGFNGILGTAARTCSAWLKTTSTIAPIVYWGNKDVAGASWEIRINGQGQLRFQAIGGAGCAANSASSVNTGQWVHVATVFPEGSSSAADVQIYINGIRDTGAITVGPINTLARTTMRIGQDDIVGPTKYFCAFSSVPL